MENDKKMNRPAARSAVLNMVYTAMFTALICVCSVISVPIGQIPVTLQTFAICTAAAALGMKRGTASVAVYILLGAIGLPVFSGMSGGFGVLAGPTGGYIIGFLLTAAVVGFVSDRSAGKLLPLIISMIVGVLLCYAVGTPWFMIVTKMDLLSSLGCCVIPFLLPDAVKISVAALIVKKLKVKR